MIIEQELPKTCIECQFLHKGYTQIGGAFYSCTKGLGLLHGLSIRRGRHCMCPLSIVRVRNYRKEAGNGDD